MKNIKTIEKAKTLMKACSYELADYARQLKGAAEAGDAEEVSRLSWLVGLARARLEEAVFAARQLEARKEAGVDEWLAIDPEAEARVHITEGALGFQAVIRLGSKTIFKKGLFETRQAAKRAAGEKLELLGLEEAS